MEVKFFTTAKAGLEEDKNEDSIFIKQLDSDKFMISLSDGATTGVFSKEFSKHITNNFDSSWISSINAFENGIEQIRNTFKPDITRPTALRKFLMEGSYATLMVAVIELKTSLFTSKIKINSMCVGDVTLFIFNYNKELIYSFPFNHSIDYTNAPDLIRSSTKLQQKSPYKIKFNKHEAHIDSLIVIASDAISEFLFRCIEDGIGNETITSILNCKDSSEFKILIDHYRNNQNMKNDDVTIFFLSGYMQAFSTGGNNAVSTN